MTVEVDLVGESMARIPRRHYLMYDACNWCGCEWHGLPCTGKGTGCDCVSSAPSRDDA